MDDFLAEPSSDECEAVQDLMFLLVIQLMIFLSLTPRPVDWLTATSFCVALASTVYTAWNIFWSERALTRLESAIVSGFGVGIMFDLQQKKAQAEQAAKPPDPPKT